ncbi:MAG: SPOR domain-containing protein [Candidatus Krumholzibacteriia bacterium]
MAEKKEPASKPAGTATRRRKSLAGDSGSRQLSRPLLIALLVVVVGGGYLFWPRGGGVPTGIGEQYSVVTTDSTDHAVPRSGSVDITAERDTLVPEPPAGDTHAEAASRQPLKLSEPAAATPQATTPPAAKPRPRAAEPARKASETPPAVVQPAATGVWAVQVGAFRTRTGADAVVSDLAAKGIAATVRAANTSGGEMIHRVWIGWFATRDDAQAFARQQKDRIGEAYPVHR